MNFLAQIQIRKARKHRARYLWASDPTSMRGLAEIVRKILHVESRKRDAAFVRITFDIVSAPDLPEYLRLVDIDSGVTERSKVGLVWPSRSAFPRAVEMYHHMKAQLSPKFNSRKGAVVWLLKDPRALIHLRRLCGRCVFVISISRNSSTRYKLVTDSDEEFPIDIRVPLLSRYWLENPVSFNQELEDKNAVTRIDYEYAEYRNGSFLRHSFQQNLITFLDIVFRFGILTRDGLKKKCEGSLVWPYKKVVESLLDDLTLYNEELPLLSQSVPCVDARSTWALKSVTSAKQFEPSRVVQVGPVEIWHGLLLVQNGQLIQTDSGADTRMAFSAGMQNLIQANYANDGRFITSSPGPLTRTMPEAIVCLGRADSNWFHWLIETLPGILACDRVTPDAVPLIVRDVIPRQAVQSLQSLLTRPIIQVAASETFRVERAVVYVHHSASNDSNFGPVVNPRFDKDLLLAAQKEIWSKVMDTQRPANQKIVTLRESHYRKLRNRAAVTRVAELHGFRHYQAEGETFAQQVTRFNETRALLVQGGAGVANAMFMQPQSSVTIMVSNSAVQVIFWSDLVRIFGLRPQFILGRPHRRGAVAGRHADFSVDLDDLARSIANLD